MKLKGIVLILFLSFFSVKSYAGVWIEPYVGYQTGAFDLTLKSLPSPFDNLNGDYEIGVKGMSYGAKLGYGLPFLAIGAQFESGTLEESLDTKPAASTITATDEYDTTMLGAWVTFTGLPMFNVTATYFFDVNWEVSKSDDATDVGNEQRGSGFSLGAGFTGLPFVSLNLEYRMLTLDEDFDKSDNTTTKLPSATQSEYDVKILYFSLSVPIEL